jgi:Zn-dependent M28 family amino/carboxypeptidase
VRRFDQENVVGLVRGTDPALAGEAVVYSAHWDHFGLADGKLFNGAVDNASGCASLLAMAQSAVASPARRSQLFLFTFGEEQGLLGAQAWVRHPPWPLARTVADLNLESLNWVGPSRDIEYLGGERSTLLETGREVAARTGLVLRPAEPDPAGLYFRSDHFPFALAGVPAASPGFSMVGQRDYLETPEASRAKAALNVKRYHTEQDDYDPAWDLRGMVQQAQFILDLGRAVADAPGRPAWKDGGRP